MSPGEVSLLVGVAMGRAAAATDTTR